MNEQLKNNSSLELHAQEGSCLEDGRCHPGILSFNPGKGYVFEETLPRPAYVPNPRIFDGKHLSVARRSQMVTMRCGLRQGILTMLVLVLIQV